MPRIQVQDELTKLERGVTQTIRMFNSLRELGKLINSKWMPIKQRDVDLIAELAGLKLFVIWEDFLEQTFIRYMCGAKTYSRYSPKLYVKAPTLTHARNILLGGRPYINWENTNEVARRAETYFRRGEPYATVLRSAQVHLDTFKVIRNRIVHSSRFAETQFQKKVENLLGSTLPKITPGRLLLSPPTSAAIPFRMKISSPPKSLLETYAEFIVVLAQKIVK